MIILGSTVEVGACSFVVKLLNETRRDNKLVTAEYHYVLPPAIIILLYMCTLVCVWSTCN